MNNIIMFAMLTGCISTWRKTSFKIWNSSSGMLC